MPGSIPRVRNIIIFFVLIKFIFQWGSKKVNHNTKIANYLIITVSESKVNGDIKACHLISSSDRE